MSCPECNHAIEPEDERTGVSWSSWSEPASQFPACRFCTGEDDERAADAYWERRLSEEREGL